MSDSSAADRTRSAECGNSRRRRRWGRGKTPIPNHGCPDVEGSLHLRRARVGSPKRIESRIPPPRRRKRRKQFGDPCAGRRLVPVHRRCVPCCNRFFQVRRCSCRTSSTTTNTDPADSTTNSRPKGMLRTMPAPACFRMNSSTSRSRRSFRSRRTPSSSPSARVSRATSNSRCATRSSTFFLSI